MPNEIGVALRDVGQGVGNILTDEAQRRKDALAAQAETNRLSLAQAQLANQAKVAEAKGQVGLAEVASKGRQFEAQQVLKEREVEQQGQYYKGQLKIGETREEREERARQDLAHHQEQVEANQREQIRLNAGNEARRIAAENQRTALEVRKFTLLENQAKQAKQVAQAPINISELSRTVAGNDPDRAADGHTFMAMMTPQGELGLYQQAPNGDILVPWAIAEPRLKAFKELQTTRSKTEVTDADLMKDAMAAFGKLDPALQQTIKPERFALRYSAQVRNGPGTRAEMQHLETVTVPALIKDQERQFYDKFKRPPTADERKNIINPVVNALREDEIDALSYRALGTKAPTPPPPAATTTTPPPAVPPPAAAPGPEAAAPAPAPVSLASAQARAQQLQENTQTLGGLLERQPNTLGGAVLGTTSGYTPPPPAVTQAVQALEAQPGFGDVPPFQRARVAREALRGVALPDGVHVVPLDNGNLWRVSVVRGQIADIVLVGGQQATPPPGTASRGTQPAGGQ
jgi:hypothetical protein